MRRDLFFNMFRISTIIFIVICYCVSKRNCDENELLVTVNEGKLQGSNKKLLDGTSYFSFKGIPYAQPPLGKLRFADPKPPLKWEGIYNATEHGPACPQYLDFQSKQATLGAENCLFLNIYTKSLKQDSKTPVMVFIHGGSYLAGSGNTDDDLGPEFLLQHDVILVTMNYRLEVLGFLSLDNPEVPGNAGMKDQVAALRWIKKNIRKFGGDPDNITLFGESAGSSSVTYHMLSPMAKGLFQKAIAQSGVAIEDWAFELSPTERAFRVGKELGKTTNDTKELLEFLRAVPATDLVGLTYKTLTKDEERRGFKIHFVPVVEKQFKNVESFITEKPIDLLIKREINAVPFMFGYTSAEGIIGVAEDLEEADFYNKNPQYYIPREVLSRVPVEKVKELGQRIKAFYVGDSDFGNDTVTSLVNLISDLNFMYNIHRFAHFYSLKNEPMYMYRFNYDTDLNQYKIYTNYTHLEGACHADDLYYLFFSEAAEDYYKGDEKLRTIVYKMTKLWTDFAKTGNPTPGNPTIKWPQYKRDTKDYLNLDDESATGKFAEKERMEFWDRIYCEFGSACMAK